MEYIQDFDRQTREQAAGRLRALILDGHGSHLTAKLLCYALEHGIEILAYPPHCTHALQGLDVVCFTRLKENWHQTASAFEALHKCKMNKEDFTELFGKAFLETFTPGLIKSAFATTDICLCFSDHLLAAPRSTSAQEAAQT